MPGKMKMKAKMGMGKNKGGNPQGTWILYKNAKQQKCVCSQAKNPPDDNHVQIKTFSTKKACENDITDGHSCLGGKGLHDPNFGW